MAQGTGAQRRLASRAPRASARVLLALAAALIALGLVGCGGDSDSDSESPASSESGAAAQTEAPGNQAAQGGPATGNGGEGEDTPSSPATGNTIPGGSPQAGAKKAPPIRLPQGEQESAPTPQERAEATIANISLTSPALGAGGSTSILPSPYTCDGENSWPALRWQGVPADTEELALFAMNVKPVGGKLFFDWAIAGLDPSSGGLEAGQLPKGAVMGQNSYGQDGYSICPPEGGSEAYVFILYALPQKLGARKGFDPRELRKEILAVSGNAGILAASYERG